ncbi:hypothetical protein HDV00_008374 [Rhizophlyctis rosea]|nr:hypothetical protein HDV00_008374 [Rhizophlyctis rosea]
MGTNISFRESQYPLLDRLLAARRSKQLGKQTTLNDHGEALGRSSEVSLPTGRALLSDNAINFTPPLVANVSEESIDREQTFSTLSPTATAANNISTTEHIESLRADKDPCSSVPDVLHGTWRNSSRSTIPVTIVAKHPRPDSSTAVPLKDLPLSTLCSASPLPTPPDTPSESPQNANTPENSSYFPSSTSTTSRRRSARIKAHMAGTSEAAIRHSETPNLKQHPLLPEGDGKRQHPPSVGTAIQPNPCSPSEDIDHDPRPISVQPVASNTYSFLDSDSELSEVSVTLDTTDSDDIPLQIRRRTLKRAISNTDSESDLSSVSSRHTSHSHGYDSTVWDSTPAGPSSDDDSDYRPKGSKGRKSTNRKKKLHKKLRKSRRRRHDFDFDDEVKALPEEPDSECEEPTITPLSQLPTHTPLTTSTDPFYTDWLEQATLNSIYINKPLPKSFPSGHTPSQALRVPLYTLSGNCMIAIKNTSRPDGMEPIAYVFSGEKYGLGAAATGRLGAAVDNVLDSGMWLPTKKFGRRFGGENSKKGAKVEEEEEEGEGEASAVGGEEGNGESTNTEDVIDRGTLLNMGIWDWRCYKRHHFGIAPPTDYKHSMLNHFTYGFQSLLKDTGSITRIARHHNFVDAEDCRKHRELVGELPPLSRHMMVGRDMYPTLVNNWNILTGHNHVDHNGF